MKLYQNGIFEALKFLNLSSSSLACLLSLFIFLLRLPIMMKFAIGTAINTISIAVKKVINLFMVASCVMMVRSNNAMCSAYLEQITIKLSGVVMFNSFKNNNLVENIIR